MAVSINWASRVITIPQADLVALGGGLYQLDVNAFRLALKDIEDGEEGMAFPDTHRHNTTVVLSGVAYARTFEIINGYTVTFEDTGTPYAVSVVGGNHNIADVKNLNPVSLIIGNSAGLIQVASGSGLSVEQSQMLSEIYSRLGLAAGKPVAQSAAQIATADWTLAVTEAAGVVTVERQP